MSDRRKTPLTWRIVDALRRAECPEVASLSTDRLAAWLDDDPRPLLLVLIVARETFGREYLSYNR